MNGGYSVDRIQEFLSQWLLDFAIGMYVYTYPASGSIVFVLNRPLNFIVSEVVNGQNMVELFSSLKTANSNGIECKCRRSVAYVVKKVGLDSMELCNIIKKTLSCKVCNVLGLKDSNAVTYQLILLRDCKSVDRHLHFKRRNKAFDAHLWQCGEVVITSTKNSFTVKLTQLSQDSIDTIKKKIDIMKSYSYTILNFFGYQRFGSRRPITHIIGRKLVYREWDGFIEALCGYPFPTESREAIIDRLQWYSEKSGRLYRYNSIESHICNRDSNDPVKIIKTIPKSILKLYVNAYQSYLFNTLLSKIWIHLIEKYTLPNAIAIIRGELQYLPIPGASTIVSRADIKNILGEILDAEDIKFSNFCIEELNLCIYGDYRRSYLAIENFQYTIHNNSIELVFTLESGCYATIVLREILNANPLLYT